MCQRYNLGLAISALVSFVGLVVKIEEEFFEATCDYGNPALQ